MPRNTMQDLRNNLFEIMERLMEGEIDVKSAQTAINAGAVIVDSAKVEADFIRDVGGRRSNLLPEDEEPRPRGLLN